MKIHTGILQFCYKDNRTYIHGPDIYNKLNELFVKELGLANSSDIDLTLYRIVKNNLQIDVFQNSTTRRDDKTTATCSFRNADDTYVAFLSESEQIVDCQYKYPEESIVKLCQIDKSEKAIQLSEPTEFTDIEVFTAMNKALLQSLWPEIEGKWIITRFKTDRYIPKSFDSHMKVVLQHNFNFKLTKSQVLIDGQPIGTIFFSLI